MPKVALLVLLIANIASAWVDKCATCHPAEVSAYLQSAMAHSLDTHAEQPEGEIRHARSGSVLTIRVKEGQMIQRVTAHGLTAEYPVAYAIGAGKVGYSYLVSIPPYMFQSPISYYTKGGMWDLTPGFEPLRILDFTRPISEGCVFCHSNSVNLVPGRINQFREPALSPISCERCHGSVDAHLKNPVAGTIVNPAKLRQNARDSVCEQCHLEGEVRILNPGKSWHDFQPGMDAESVFGTYIKQVPKGAALPAVSQEEELSLSRCARESGGRLWCGSCHKVHATTTDRQRDVREVCLSCHQQLFAAQKHEPRGECVSCHMPRLQPGNVAHAAITDHQIVAKPELAEKAQKSGSPTITVWRNPPGPAAERDLGLALFQVGSEGKNWPEIERSYEILSHLPQRDADVLSVLGSILLAQPRPDLAVKLYQQAIDLEPRNARFHYVLGVALYAQGKIDDAIAALRRSIVIDPSAPDAYLKLSLIYEKAGEKQLAKQVREEYLKFMPQSLSFRLDLDSPATGGSLKSKM